MAPQYLHTPTGLDTIRVHLALYNMQGQRIRILANAEFNVG